MTLSRPNQEFIFIYRHPNPGENLLAYLELLLCAHSQAIRSYLSPTNIEITISDNSKLTDEPNSN